MQLNDSIVVLCSRSRVCVATMSRINERDNSLLSVELRHPISDAPRATMLLRGAIMINDHHNGLRLTGQSVKRLEMNRDGGKVLDLNEDRITIC